MPKRKGPWWRATHKGWYATVDRKQHALGIRDENALAGPEAAYQLLLARLKADLAASGPVSRTVSTAAADYLAKRAGKVSAGTLEGYRYALNHFAAAFGSRALHTLKGEEIEDWAGAQRTPAGEPWSSSYRNGTLGAVMTFLGWAGHPLKLKRPPKESRGAETCLSDEQFARVIARLRANGPQGDLCELLAALRETGARPQELATLCVEAVDWANRCARLTEHKTARHGITRTVHFSE